MTITLGLWNSMSLKRQTLWLENNCKYNGGGRPRGLVHGVGINDSAYCQQPRIEGKQVECPAYASWRGALERSYSKKYLSARPTYLNVSVCDEWHRFSTFRIWWLQNQVDGWQLDKDLLSDDEIYSPESCIFVPSWLNSFTVDAGARRGDLPIGVYYNKGKGRFCARCNNPKTKIRETLGYFKTPESAYLSWRGRKLEIAMELKREMDEIDSKIYARVVEIIMKAK